MSESRSFDVLSRKSTLESLRILEPNFEDETMKKKLLHIGVVVALLVVLAPNVGADQVRVDSSVEWAESVYQIGDTVTVGVETGTQLVIEVMRTEG